MEKWQASLLFKSEVVGYILIVSQIVLKLFLV